MMQVTRAEFQVVANLNEQAADPKSHTLVKNPLLVSLRTRYLLNFDIVRHLKKPLSSAPSYGIKLTGRNNASALDKRDFGAEHKNG